MTSPREVVGFIEEAGFTQVVWIPDSTLGKWDSALSQSTRLQLIRPCREGEAIGIAIGLMLGQARPLVVLQCTGLFEAGDALRNAVHDLHLPLKLLVGVRSYHAAQSGKSRDNCPRFTAPILEAWQIPYRLVPSDSDLPLALAEMARSEHACAILYPE